MPTLSQIFIYPVKSLTGIQVEQWPVDATGLRYDRKWMLIDSQHQFLSQRRLPKMALIKTRIDGHELILSAPGQEDLAISLHSKGGDTVKVDIWHDRCEAKTVSEQADIWLRRFLACDCRLVYHPDESVRQVDQRYANADDQTAFSDGFPFLVVAENSLHELNEAMQSTLTINRFRPNLVISGCDAYAEDRWRRIRINGIVFRLPKPCSRCSVPTIDPETAIMGKEPLATLNRLRKQDNKVYFGQNALHDGLGSLAVGDAVTILETGLQQPALEH